MKRGVFILLILFSIFPLRGQEVSRYSLSGVIRDSVTGEHLAGASVWVPLLKKGTSSNGYGYYALTLPAGHHELEITFVGYRKLLLSLDIEKDTILNRDLTPGIEVGEVSVTARRSDNTLTRSPVPGVYYLSAARSELVPALLGEPDALKTIQLLPGVKAGNEGTAGINVRGGSHDQNLILLDGVPVYNTNHLFGYLSTFNTDAIRDMRFFKGGIPARYGGRLSSVIDIAMKEGNLKESGGQFSVSPLSGRLMVEGPIKKDTASYMISGRRSWLDLPLKTIQFFKGNTETLGYTFYDLNAKINWRIGAKSRIYLSHYQGRDQYFVNAKDTLKTDKYSFHWGNLTSVIRWNFVITPGLFMNSSAYHSLYRFKEQFETVDKNKKREGQYSRSGLEEYSLKGDLDYSLENHVIRMGYQFSWHSFLPELNTLSGYDTGIIPQATEKVHNRSFAIYGEDEMALTDRFKVIGGVRLLLFGAGSTTRYYAEPRLSAGYSLTESTDLKLSVQRMVQTIHLLTNNSLNMPTDLWITAGEKIAPAEAWMGDLGVSVHSRNGWGFEADVYYKPMSHVLEYRPGVAIYSGSGKGWEELTLAGKGLNYGSEIMVEKSLGRVTGWAGYSLAWAKRKFSEINKGEYFPFKYDRRHDFSLLANYNLRDSGVKRKLLTLSFVFATGNAITIPDEHIEGLKMPGWGEEKGFNKDFSFYESFPHPNNYRMPPFHHLDLAYSAVKKNEKGRERTLKISVYNVYNRLNPYFYYKYRDSFYQISMMPVVPSVSWSLKF